MAKTTGWTKDLLFITPEVSFPTLIQPAAANAVYVIEPPVFKQPVPMLDDPQRRDTASKIVQLRDKSDVGTFSFKTLLKASGTAGTAVQAGLHAALTGAIGRTTVNAGVNVTYNLLRMTDTLPSYSIFQRVGDDGVLEHAGCIFTKVTIVILAKGAESLLQATFEGIFARQYRAMHATTTTGSDTTHLELSSGMGQFFDAGAFIQATGLTASGNAYFAITSIATDQLTVPTLSGSAGSGISVKGYYPTPTDSGHIISGWRGIATLGGTNFPVIRAEFVFEQKHEILTDVKNNSDYADEFIANANGTRDCTGTIEYYFDPKTAIAGANKWYNALNQTQQALVVPVGNAAGKIFTFNAPIAELMDTPDLDTSGKNKITCRYRFLGSSSLDDEVNVVLT